MKVCLGFNFLKKIRIECEKDGKQRLYKIKKLYDYYNNFNIKCWNDGKLIQNEDYGVGGIETLLQMIYENRDGERIFKNIKLYIEG